MDSEDAVSTTIGEVLMLVVVFGIVAWLSVLIEPEAPEDQVHVRLEGIAHCGLGGFGEGDERVVLTHQGGEPIEERGLRVLISIDGQTTALEAADLGVPWDDGAMTIGEAWALETNVTSGAVVRWTIVTGNDDESSRIVADGIVRKFTCGGTVITTPLALVDPGFAYEDVDGDCRYTEFTDVQLADADVLDGAHTAGADHGLVIPASIGPVSVPASISYEAKASCLRVFTDLDAGQDVSLRADGATMRLNDTTITAGDDIDIDADLDLVLVDADVQAGDALDLRSARTITLVGTPLSSGGNMGFVAGRDLDAGAGAITSGGALVADAAGQVLGADADISARLDLTITSGEDMDLQRALLQSTEGAIVLDKTTDANPLFIADADIDEPLDNGNADVRPDHTQGVVGAPATGGLD